MKQSHAWTATELKALNKVSRNFYRTAWNKLTNEERDSVLDMMNEYPHLWEVDERKAARFYYNDKLVRTSKNHHYTHAVIDMASGKVCGCRTSREAAEAIIVARINMLNDIIESDNNAVKAIQNGETKYRTIEGRKAYKTNVRMSEEQYRAHSEQTAEHLKEVMKNWKIVELEER